MNLRSCIAVIPTPDVEKSLRFWVEGLGLTVDQEMKQEGKMIGCMVHNEKLYFWLNHRPGEPVTPGAYQGIRLYWGPDNMQETRECLKALGFEVTEIVDREYGQTEFFATDDDGYLHCFGVATSS